MTVTKFETRKTQKRRAARVDVAKPLGCKCEDLALTVGLLHATARCADHVTPLPASTGRFHVDRDLVAAINADLAVVDVAQSDRGTHTMTILCGHLMALMRIIDTAPQRVELLTRVHRECEVALTELLSVPRMTAPPTP